MSKTRLVVIPAGWEDSLLQCYMIDSKELVGCEYMCLVGLSELYSIPLWYRKVCYSLTLNNNMCRLDLFRQNMWMLY